MTPENLITVWGNSLGSHLGYNGTHKDKPTSHLKTKDVVQELSVLLMPIICIPRPHRALPSLTLTCLKLAYMEVVRGATWLANTPQKHKIPNNIQKQEIPLTQI